MNPANSLAQRVSPGGCANLMLDRIRQRLEQQLGRQMERGGVGF
jgi:hypothetical protein